MIKKKSGDLWLGGVFFGSNSSGHAEYREGFQERVATGAAADALPPSGDDEDDGGSGGDAPQHRKLKQRRGSGK